MFEEKDVSEPPLSSIQLDLVSLEPWHSRVHVGGEKKYFVQFLEIFYCNWNITLQEWKNINFGRIATEVKTCSSDSIILCECRHSTHNYNSTSIFSYFLCWNKLAALIDGDFIGLWIYHSSVRIKGTHPTVALSLISLLLTAFESFQYLLEKKACMADICEWINDLIERHLTSRIAAGGGGDERGGHGLASTAKRFLEAWRTISNGIFRALCNDEGHSRPNSDAKSKNYWHIFRVTILRLLLHYLSCEDQRSKLGNASY